MLHLSTGLLQEYGLWQLLTAFAFFAAGLIFESKLQDRCLARSCAVLGVMLCVDELLMLHECLDQHWPAHLFLGLEFMSAAGIGGAVLRQQIFNRPMTVLLILTGMLALAAYGLEFVGINSEFVRMEEGLEVACALLGLGLAVLAPGALQFSRFAVRAVFWAIVGAAGSVLILLARPQVCSTVDHWSKKYFHEQIW